MPDKVKTLRKGTQRLIECLWIKHGGVPYIAKVIGLHSQNLLNWKYFGRVPLEKVGKLSRWMDVSPYAINYQEVSDYEGRAFNWEDLVKNWCDLTPQQIKYVLSGTVPVWEETEL